MRNRTEIEIELTLIRHGMTRANLEHRYLGRTDEPLSEEGRRLLQDRKAENRYSGPGLLFVSPSLRCRQTAELLFPGVGYQPIGEWTEIDFGLFEGKNYRELGDDAAYQEWVDSGGRLPFPGGEGREAFVARVMQGFHRMLSSLPGPGQECTQVTAVVHGGTIMALCSSLTGGEYFDYQVECGGGYECHLRCMDRRIELSGLGRLC